MFKIRVWIRIGAIYFLLFFLISFWYSSKLEINETTSQSKHLLAIIVPYRNRSNELEMFVPHMNLFLKSQSIDHIFMIINQVDIHRFNRAALINIGFIESQSFADYIVMHDIDLLPLNYKELRYDYPDNGPVHLASPKYHPLYHYSTYVGGILMITCKDFERVNGMSPLYWGWGREDDNFYVRMKLAGMKIYRPNNLSTNTTNTFRHIHDKGVHKRDHAKYGKQKEEGRKIYPEMGFNTTKYEIINKNIKKTNEGIEYNMLDVKIECDYNLTPWCDHLTNIYMSLSRVVITGLGVVSPLGAGVEINWRRLLDNYSGIVSLDPAEYAGIPCQVAGRVPISSENKSQDGSLNFTDYFPRMSELKSMSLASAFALVAAQEAIEQSQILSVADDRTRIGVSIGNGMAGLTNTCTIWEQMKSKGIYRGMSPFYITQILSNSSAGYISIRHKLQGPNLCNSSACAAGVQAIGDGYNMIRLGHADAMVCGGTEATVNPISISGFARMRALSTSFNDQPKLASRPFDRQRDGFVMGEGAAVLILERLEYAEKRGAKILGEILAYGLSSDASHITNPSGSGALNCMKNALNNAGLSTKDIGYINAHATSTPIGDRIERQAITQLFQSDNSNILVSSTKGHTGHLLGAAGALESLFTVLACYHAQCPSTLNYKSHNDDSEDSSLLLNIISDDKPSSWNNKKRIALKNSFGFGGTNACLVLSNFF